MGTLYINCFGDYWEARLENDCVSLLNFSLSGLLRQIESYYGLKLDLLTFSKN